MMLKKSVFDIIGPVMIGPSSSHTAGAVKIGNVARSVLGEKPVHALIVLYGSFAQTYRGHGTDRALVAGLLGMESDNPDIKEALTIAPDQGLTVQFEFGTGGEFHPNTADITLRGISNKKIFLRGSSVGGGEVIITKINQYQLSVDSHTPTLLVEHLDQPGVVGSVTTKLGDNRINIAEMQVVASEPGAASCMAAAAAVEIAGGTPSQAANAGAIALKNFLGLVCDPVAGLVEVPCVKRNAIGAAVALLSADMALAGIKSKIPLDEVIVAMREIGDALPSSLKETSQGGLANTPTARMIEKRLRQDGAGR